MPDKRKFLIDYTELDKLPGWMWENGKPILSSVFNENFTPEDYIKDALQFVKEHPGEQLTYLNPIVIKPLDGKIFDNANFRGKRVNKLIDSQGRVIFENKTGKRLRDLIEVNYKGGKGYVDWNPLTNKKTLVAYLLPNDLYPQTLPEGYDVNPIEEEWDLQYNLNYLNWKELLPNKPKVTIESFNPSNSPIGQPIAKLFTGLMTLPVAEATGIAENLTKAAAPYITKGINYFKNLKTPSSMTLYGPGYGIVTKSVWRNLGEQALASTAGFEGMNLVSKSVTGKNWGDTLRSILPDGPKWIPEWGKLILADATNIGGWATPNMFYNGYNAIINKATALRTLKERLVDKFYTKYPGYETVYHGSTQAFNPKKFSTLYEIGLHASPNIDISKHFGNYIYKMHIPKRNRVKVVDLAQNDYRIFANDQPIQKLVLYGPNYNSGLYGLPLSYNMDYTRGGKELYNLVLKNNGWLPQSGDYVVSNPNTRINFLDEFFPNMSNKMRKLIDKVLTRIPQDHTIERNQRISEIVKRKYPILEYDNVQDLFINNKEVSRAILDRNTIKGVSLINNPNNRFNIVNPKLIPIIQNNQFNFKYNTKIIEDLSLFFKNLYNRYTAPKPQKFEILKAIRSTKDAPKTLYIGTEHNDKIKLSLAERLGIPKEDRFKFDPMQTTVRLSFRKPLGQMENGVVTSKRFGNQIGVGTEHYVYEDVLDPNYVLKILYRDPNSTLQGLSQTVNKSLSKNNIPFFENITYQGHLKGSNGELYPVFRQKKIDAKPVSESDWADTYFPILLKKFKPLQFIPEEIDGPFRRNLPQSIKTTNYLNIGDLSPNNVLFINGKPKIIDPYVYKKGGSIHIKEKNKGKFTEYCNGKVTQKCIDKAKKSGNKKLVKRAVFALNSRSWNTKK